VVTDETGNRRLRPGDVVELRPAAEILARLDSNASLGGMPFMPELLQHAGKRLTVSRRVEKICNNVDDTQTPGRRMRSTVHLEDLRCDGSGHDGCQLGCRIYWREEWLRPAGTGNDGAAGGAEAAAELEALALRATKTRRERDGMEVEAYRCQATEAVAASEPLDKYDPRQFVREVSAGNAGPLHVARVLVHALWFKVLRHLGRRSWILLPSSSTKREAGREPLGLKPGELVRVRSQDQVAATLNEKGFNRGLSFDQEMLPHCGKTYRVRDRIVRFIEEKTGEMVTLESDCVVLDGVCCTSERSTWAFLFCPRGTYPFWREAWLERAESATELRST
jgi:hypothetical protein